VAGFAASRRLRPHADWPDDDGGVPRSQSSESDWGGHRYADNYTLAGGSTVATLDANETTATPYPAVVVNTFGNGQAAVFSYDLAQTVVYIRQGNPATAGTDVDSDDGVARTIEAFENSGVPLDRIPVPMADEQQRLLANVVVAFSEQTTPVPRLWYFPSPSTTSVMLYGW
jgi:hypothetical protein